MVLSFLEYDIVPIIITKLLVVLFLCHIINETPAKRKLMLYKNLGVSSFKLFGLVFIVDIFLSFPFLLVLKEFI